MDKSALKVKDLIEVLKSFDPEAVVVVNCHEDTPFFGPIYDIIPGVLQLTKDGTNHFFDYETFIADPTRESIAVCFEPACLTVDDVQTEEESDWWPEESQEDER